MAVRTDSSARLRFVLWCCGTALERWHVVCLDRLNAVATLVGVVAERADGAFSPERDVSPALAAQVARLRQAGAVEVARVDASAPRITRAAAFGDSTIDILLRLGRAPVPDA